MRRIVFVEPKPPDLHIFTRMPMPRLGTVLLGTILRQKGYEVKSYVEVVRDLDIEDILKGDGRHRPAGAGGYGRYPGIHPCV